jgi:hypothetical protein
MSTQTFLSGPVMDMFLISAWRELIVSFSKAPTIGQGSQQPQDLQGGTQKADSPQRAPQSWTSDSLLLCLQGRPQMQILVLTLFTVNTLVLSGV